MPSENRYLILSEKCSLRNLETPCVYNKAEDELYELDAEAFGFLQKCDGSKRLKELRVEPEFLKFCFKEGILSTLSEPHVRHFNAEKSPTLSLRYMELHLTGKCNLRCRHCYLSAGEGKDLELLKLFKALDDFDRMQGLRLLISGGEPLMHRQFWYLNEKLKDYGFRSVLLSNGSMITKETAARLKVHEAQISIDGMRDSHDILRGEGTFDKAVRSIEYLQAEGIKVSVSTTVNAVNRRDFEGMNMLIDSMGVSEWNVDIPSVIGRLKHNPEFILAPEKAAPFISYGFGGSHHSSSDGYACGSHLCAVGTHGQVAKCGFYIENPVGSVMDGLKECWSRIRPTRISELSCDCDYLEACKGGCRYRATTYTDELGPDPVRCHSLGVCSTQPKGGDPYDHQKAG